MSPLTYVVGIALILFGIYAALVAPYQLWRMYRFYYAPDWPVAMASPANSSTAGSSEDMQYSYRVKDIPYVSSERQHEFLIPMFSNGGEIEASFPVHYDPKQPSIVIAKPGLGMLILNLLLAPLAYFFGLMLIREK